MELRISCLSATIAVMLFAASSCGGTQEEHHSSYETLTLSRQDVEFPLTWSASLVGKNDVSITPQISGQLMKVCVTEGQRVKKGTPLFLIDDRQPKLDLETAKANLYAAQAQCSTAELEYESNRNLYEKKIVSSYMLNTSLNDLERAKAAVAQAEAALSNARLNLSWCTVTSPVSGLVGSITNNPGDMVSQVSVLTKVAGNTEMDAKFSITETEVKGIIDVGGPIEKVLDSLPPVTLTLKDNSVYPLEGKITSIAGVVDNVTGSVKCKATFPNPDGKLYSGIQGTVTMNLLYENQLVIPMTAVVRMQDKTLVYKVKDNCAEVTVVEIEECDKGKNAVVVDGLEEGDVIVAVGASNVYDGQQVVFPEEK